jgi:UDP-N-acetyl-D-galactosamine dehydrogenase
MASTPDTGAYDAVSVAVAHEEFTADNAAAVATYAKPEAVIFDVKAVLPRSEGILRL